LTEEDSELIDLIYAAMLGERDWEDFVSRLARTSPDGCALMFSYDRRRGDPIVTILQGRDDDTRDQLERHYGVLNPYAPYCMVKPLGVGVVGDRMVSRERLIRTEFFNDFMIRNDTTSTVGIAVDRSDDFTILISTATRQNDEAEQRRLADQYSRLAPHLQRAAAFYRRNAPSRMASELGCSLYDAVDVGTMLVTPSLRVASMSGAAERLLAPYLSFDHAGRVRLPSEAPQTALHSMCATRYEGPHSASFTVGCLHLTLVRISRGGVVGLFDDCGVAVLARADPSGNRRMSQDAIRRAFGLTPAEMRVLQAVIAGQTTEQIAQSFSRSRETIRSQIKSIYQKTDCPGRMALMRLVGGAGMWGDGTEG
jgi:DNA-binding CsgD family transcriptional regulator